MHSHSGCCQQDSRSKNLHFTFVFYDSFKKWLRGSVTLHPHDIFPTENVHGASHGASCLSLRVILRKNDHNESGQGG